MTSIPQEQIAQKLQQDHIDDLKLQIAEQYPLPPKPLKPRYMGLTAVAAPSTPEGKVVFDVASSLALGAFLGATRAWFYDYKKVPNIQYMQSLRVNARYIKTPMLVTALIGSTWSLINYAMDRYNREQVRPINTNKDQSLTQEFWKATLATSSATLALGASSSFSASRMVPISVSAGLIYMYYCYMNRSGSTMDAVRRSQLEKMDIARDPLKYKALDRAAALINPKRFQYAYFYEERVDGSEPKGPQVEYVEE